MADAQTSTVPVLDAVDELEAVDPTNQFVPIDLAGLNSTDHTQKRADAAMDTATQLAQEIGGNSVDAMEQFSSQISKQTARLVSLEKAFAKDPKNKDLALAINQTQRNIQNLQDKYSLAQGTAQAELLSNQQQMAAQVYADPASLIKKANTPNLTTAGGFIAEGTGQLSGNAPLATAQQVGGAATAAMPAQFDAATYQAALASPAMQGVVNSIQAQQGQLSPQALIEAITMDPNALSQLQITAAQIDQARQVKTPEQLKMQEGEMLSGSSVDWERINEVLDVQAAQADPTKLATVRGQLELLMQDFDGKDPPAWASGALRQAAGTMLARGLGASSIAGMAVVQAAMEAATPIAMADAQTYATFELANLNNRQQVVMLAAQQRAQFLGQEFDQEFQTRVLNAQRIGEIANINYSTEVQVALENARLAQSVDIANLNARNAKLLADAAAMTQIDLTNLNHRQQAAVANAQAFLAMDMTNLEYRQQTELFRGQMLAQAVLSDQAAINAAAQFNASSENQVNMFFADLSARVSQFNASQVNAINMFNVEQANAVSMFNSEMLNQREMFNAQNSLVIAQANAQWRQTVKLTKFAAKQEANMQAAKETNALTAAALDQIWQRERDIMDYAFRASEGSAERTMQLMLGDKSLTAAREAAAAEKSASNTAAIGGIFAKLLFGGI